MDSIFQVNRFERLNWKPLRRLAIHQPRYAKYISCEHDACVCVRRSFVFLCFDRRNTLANESETSETATFSTNRIGRKYRFLLESKSFDCVQYLIAQHPSPEIKTRKTNCPFNTISETKPNQNWLENCCGKRTDPISNKLIVSVCGLRFVYANKQLINTQTRPSI